MDEQLTALLDELHSYGVSYDADKPDRLDRLRNLEPDTAALLALLVRATGAQKILELGTSNGYSTLWLADAVKANDGQVTSIEIDAERSSQAARNLDRAGAAFTGRAANPGRSHRAERVTGRALGPDLPRRGASCIPQLLARPRTHAQAGRSAGHRQRHIACRPSRRIQGACQHGRAGQRSARPDRGRPVAHCP